MFRSQFAICWLIVSVAIIAPLTSARATPAKLDDQTCKDMRGEKQKFLDSGVLANVERGPAWAKANMSPDQLRQVELFLMLDEQLKFACRDAVISLDAAKAGDTAKLLEANPDADPNAPPKSKSNSALTPGVVPPPLAPSVKQQQAKEKAQAKLKPARPKPKRADDALKVAPSPGDASNAEPASAKPPPKPKPKPVTVTVEPDPAATARDAAKSDALPWAKDNAPATPGGISP